MLDTKKYIIDTDIGDDIDDAFAIKFAVNAGLNIIGITTVFRNSSQRAKMTKLLLKLCGRGDIPIFAGTDSPFIQRIENILPADMIKREMAKGYYHVPQYLPEMEQEQYENIHAVDYIIDCARKFKKDLTILAIGPLTNIALAIRKAPDIVNDIGEICLIGGYYFKDSAEWNIACDPEAARIVFTSGAKIRAIGIDLTQYTVLTDTDMQVLTSSRDKCNELLYQMTIKWWEHYGKKSPIMHDSLLIAAILDEAVVKFNLMRIKIGLEGSERCKTITETDPSRDNAVIDVAKDLNLELFFAYFRKYAL